MKRFCSIACGIALVCFMGIAHADTHHNGHDLIKGKLNTNGKHELHTTGNHTAHAHVKDGKISHVEVTHKTKGATKVTKYKSAKKHHAQAEPGIQHHYASIDAANDCGAAIAFVGFGFVTDTGLLIIYWFPVTIVLNGDAGAVVYNP
jgi:hypothetical protein